MQKNVLAIAASVALGAGAPVAAAPVPRRRLTVNITIEAETADDSELAPLVAESLQEFMDSTEARTSMAGKFEAKTGMDVSWRVMNRYYDEHGKLHGVLGVNEAGKLLDTVNRVP